MSRTVFRKKTGADEKALFNKVCDFMKDNQFALIQSGNEQVFTKTHMLEWKFFIKYEYVGDEYVISAWLRNTVLPESNLEGVTGYPAKKKLRGLVENLMSSLNEIKVTDKDTGISDNSNKKENQSDTKIPVVVSNPNNGVSYGGIISTVLGLLGIVYAAITYTNDINAYNSIWSGGYSYTSPLTSHEMFVIAIGVAGVLAVIAGIGKVLEVFKNHK